MSGQSIPLNNGQQAIIQTDLSRIFLWNKRSQKGVLNNSTYAAITYPAGTLMGRVAVGGKVKPLTSGASDGSQLPVGILMDDYVIGASTNANVYFCDQGDVASEKVILQGSDTLDTVVSGRQLRDHIAAMGIKLITTTEMTNYDNQ